MAREHGKIKSSFWQNHKVRRLGDRGKLLLAYLFSSPHATAASAYVLPMNYASHDLGWDVATVAEGFKELALKPFALRDEGTDVVFIPGWWEHNKPENPNVAGYAAKLLLALPDCQLKARAIKGMREEVKFTDAIYKVLGEWSYEPSQEQLPLQLPQQPDKPSHEGFSQSRAEQSLTEPNRTEQRAPARVRKAKSPRTRLTEDWQPDPSDRHYAVAKGLTESEISAEILKFVRYWTGPDAAKGGLKSDWPRTWANWIDRCAGEIITRRPRGISARGAEGPMAPAPSASSPFDDRWPLRIASYRKALDEGRKPIWLPDWGNRPDEDGPHLAPADVLNAHGFQVRSEAPARRGAA